MHFLYDIFHEFIEILFLLFVVIFLVSFIQGFFPPEKVKQLFNRSKGSYFLGALVGIVTPFCCCTSIPVFIGLVNAGLPIGITMSFLISSALLDLGVGFVLIDIFSLRFFILYIALVFLFAVVGGALAGRLNLGKGVNKDLIFTTSETNSKVLHLKSRLAASFHDALNMVQKLFFFVLFGVLLGAIICNLIPTEIITEILGSNNPLGVLIATLIGTPIHAEVFTIMPLAQTLLTKGAGIGTVFSFMISVSAISISSIVILKKAMTKSLLSFFLIYLVLSIVITGYIFNLPLDPLIN